MQYHSAIKISINRPRSAHNIGEKYTQHIKYGTVLYSACSIQNPRAFIFVQEVIKFGCHKKEKEFLVHNSKQKFLNKDPPAYTLLCCLKHEHPYTFRSSRSMAAFRLGAEMGVCIVLCRDLAF
jgi:hypothetical protein